MSIQHSSAVWTASVGDPVAKLVLLKLADNANSEGRCWPSIARICAETELSERTVQRKMSMLESAGLIERNRGKNCCDYVLRLEKLNDRLPDSHHVTVTPRQADTPSHSHPYPVTVTPLPRHSDSCLTREPSMNRHRTTEERSESDREKAEQALQILNAYPRKEKFANALSIVRKDLEEGIDFNEMLKSTIAIAKVLRSLPSGAGNRYVPGAESFFRDKRWQDDPETFRRAGENFNEPAPKKKTGFTSSDVGI